MGKKIFIDKFFVPADAAEEFVQRMNYNRTFLKKLQGFITDYGYKQTDEKGDAIIITVAVWESLDAIHKAKEAVQEEYKRIGFNPADFYEKFNIRMERGIYQEI